MNTILYFSTGWVLINGPTFNTSARSAELYYKLRQPATLIMDLSLEEVGQLMGGN